MLKGWKFEAFMIMVVIVMLGQLLDQQHVDDSIDVDTPEILAYPRA